MVIVTDNNGIEKKALKFQKIDIDVNGEKDFEIQFQAGEYTAIDGGNRIFVPDTEYGGIVGGIKSDTSAGIITISGLTWRGVLAKKIIFPPSGQDYKTVTGDIAEIISNLLNENGLQELFVVPAPAGVNVSYQFDRYTTLLDGIEKMLKTVGYKIGLTYAQSETGGGGQVQVLLSEIKDLSADIELSQDSRLNFTFARKYNGINHLVCLGQGELSDRVVVDLYVQEDGTIGTTQYYYGLQEYAEVYEDTAAENEQALTERGTEKLKELMNTQTFNMNVSALTISAEIGDIIGGRDYMTGLSMSKPIVNKIYIEENGLAIVEYVLEGEQ